MTIVTVIIAVLGGYLSAYVFYLLILFFARELLKEKDLDAQGPLHKFLILIPAHNEEILIPRLLESVNNINYPADKYKTVVVADNCTDNTAQVSREKKAVVLERDNKKKVGKGYTLKYGLENTVETDIDAILIVDADCVLHKDVLLNFNKQLKNGKKIIQSYSGLANPDESWFTRLLHVSQIVSNEIFLNAKRKLGLSIPLMGTGMCFVKDVLLRHGWDAFSVGEDWEFYAKLIHEGETIAFAKDAYVYHQESADLRQATSQRLRWSSGRFAIAGKYGFGLFFKGIIEGNLVKMEASFPLILPNPSLGINITMLGWSLALINSLVTNNYIYLVWFTVLLFIQVGFFLLGITYTDKKVKYLSTLIAAPLFLIWKLIIDLLSALGIGRKDWVRTERKI